MIGKFFGWLGVPWQRIVEMSEFRNLDTGDIILPSGIKEGSTAQLKDKDGRVIASVVCAKDEDVWSINRRLLEQAGR